MKKKPCLLLTLAFALLLSGPLLAQFTQAGQYPVWVEKNLTYGTALNYVGHVDTLKLDIYKPGNNLNPHRPLLVLVHGGSWLTGCKEDFEQLAYEMAGRGYVVASINYRLGWHKQATVPIACGTQDFPDVFPNEYAALYAADSLEIIRAIYRGQQDVKGAIRWLKNRHDQDSTCTQAVLVGGASAGGFLALASALIDRPEEKPACCSAIAAAPQPSANTLNYSTPACVPTLWPITTPALLRPDLGPINGAMNANLPYDAKVIGVLNFFGAVPAIALQQDWIQGPDTPAIYLYHQTCDVVVPFNYGHPFYPISGICNGYANCSPWHQQTPNVYGSGAIASYLNSLPAPPPFLLDLTNCDPFNSDLGIVACLAFANNGSYHFIANTPLRAQNAANFYNPLLVEAIQGGCVSSSTFAPTAEADLQVSPNPGDGHFQLLLHHWPPGAALELRAYTLSGQLIYQRHIDAAQRGQILEIDLSAQTAGIYMLQVQSGNAVMVRKVVVE